VDKCSLFDYELHIKLVILHFCAIECRMPETELFSFPVTSRIPDTRGKTNLKFVKLIEAYVPRG